MIEPTEQGKHLFIADFIRYATEEDPHNVSHAFSGETCIQKFMDPMNQLTEVGDKQRNEVPLLVSGRHDYLQRFTLFSPNASGRVA